MFPEIKLFELSSKEILFLLSKELSISISLEGPKEFSYIVIIKLFLQKYKIIYLVKRHLIL